MCSIRRIVEHHLEIWVFKCYEKIFLSESALTTHILSVHNDVIIKDQIPLVIELAKEDVQHFAEFTCPPFDERNLESPLNEVEN